MSVSNSTGEQSPQAKSFPLWPSAILLGLILLLGFLAWMVGMARERMQISRELLWLPGWILSYLAPGSAVIVFLLALRARHRGIRRRVLQGLLSLVVIQGFAVGQGMFRLKTSGSYSPYSSIREYVPATSRPLDWPDPLQPLSYELGGGVKLCMSTVCFVDGSKHTLPRVSMQMLPQLPQDASIRPLIAERLQNLVAFTRAMGYVRFFHPSDEAANVDWNKLAILGMRAMEDAATPQELAQRLQTFYAPFAPTVQFMALGESPRKLELPKDGTQLVRWRHIGLGKLPASAVPFDRSMRLADVAITWTVMQHFYPYFDVVHTDWSAELPKALQQAATDPDALSFQRTLRKLTAALKDGHGNVGLAGSKGVLVPPIRLRLLEGRAYVKAGPKLIPQGSEILAFNGEPTADRLARKRLEISAASEGWMAFRLAERLLVDRLGTKMLLAFRNPGGECKELEVPLEKPSEALQHQGLPAKLAELRPGVWYADLDRISEEDFKAALPKLAEAKGVIFDLRGYPKMGPEFLQHLTDMPIQSARWNVPIVTQPDGRNWAWNTSGRWDLKPMKPKIKGKVAFLTGGGAISYAESCLGIVEAYKLAEIVGEPSAGTNGNVNLLTLPGGYTISWTGMKVLKHDGSQHHGIGILPTIPVQPTPKGLAEGRDEVLERALEFASH